MSTPSVLVIGAGSAGQRHARLLAQAGAQVALTDPASDRANSVEGVTPRSFDIDRLGSWDGIVLASPTSFHESQLPAALDAAPRVLVEKPLATTGSVARALAEAAPDRIMVGYNLRLHEPYQRLIAGIHDGRVGRHISVRLWFGSYLPDWRPEVDYRQTYSARQSLGGGVLLDAIHEIDLLLWLLPGDHRVEAAVVSTDGELDIDVEDNVHALLRHRSGVPVYLNLDYLSRRYRRGIEVVGTEGSARLDWARQVLEWDSPTGPERERADTSVMHSYEKQAHRFLQFITNGTPPPVDGPTGAQSVELADAIRAASRA